MDTLNTVQSCTTVQSSLQTIVVDKQSSLQSSRTNETAYGISFRHTHFSGVETVPKLRVGM